MPKMVALLIEGLSLISEAAGSTVKKKYPGKDLHIGKNSGIAVGHLAVLSAS